MENIINNPQLFFLYKFSSFLIMVFFIIRLSKMVTWIIEEFNKIQVQFASSGFKRQVHIYFADNDKKAHFSLMKVCFILTLVSIFVFFSISDPDHFNIIQMLNR